MWAERRKSMSAASNRKSRTSSISRPVPATTPYRRPIGSRRANTSNTQRRPAVPSLSAALTMVSS
jgi:hypothetical protein